MTVTIFTPTFNRENSLKILYESLINQTSKDFEWVIVDDGSTDNTEETVLKFIVESIINIRYFKQKNGGKHRAINTGLQKADGELFFIVDSDDYLTPDAVEFYVGSYDKIKENKEFAGISGRRVYKNGKNIGSAMPATILDTTAIDLRMKFGVQGDMAEAYRTDILKRFPFPEIAGERFCPEALVWNRIAQHYKLRYYDKGFYVCEYLPGGLTSRITKLRMNSPQTSMLYYKELESFNIPLLQKLRTNINFWRFAFNVNKNFFAKLKKISFINSLIGLPLGFLFYLKDKSE